MRADLDSTVWRGVTCDSTTFALSTARGAEFGVGTRFVGATFDRATLTGAVFDGVDLTGASLFRADLTNVKFRKCNLTSVDASSAIFKETTIEDCRIEGLQLEGTDREAVTMVRCSGVPMRRAYR
jgi:uncharacterized protein YjbI with pentapeptide repeats